MLFVCACLHVCECAYLYMHTWRSEVDVGYLPQFFALALKTRSLTGLELAGLAALIGQGAPRIYPGAAVTGGCRVSNF